jgi:hypothetical protein
MAKMNYRQVSTISCCEKCSNGFGKCGLQVLNLIDFAIGIVLLSLGLFLKVNMGSDFGKGQTSWVGWIAFGMGGMLVLVSFLSLMAIEMACCRWAILPSGYLAIILSIVALGSAIALLIMHEKFIDYLDDNHSDVGLSTNDVSTIKTWYMIAVYSSFFVSVSSLIRFFSSRPFYNSAVKIDGDFANLIDIHDRLMDEEHDEKRELIYEKYDTLRDHYRNKYNRDGARDHNARNEQA